MILSLFLLPKPTFFKTFFLWIYIIFLQNAEQIFGSKVRKHMLLFINTTVESQNALLEDFRDVASEFKEKVSFLTK